jgi:hypothetical protein
LGPAQQLRPVVGKQHHQGHAHANENGETGIAAAARRPTQVRIGLRQLASHDQNSRKAGYELEQLRQADEGPDLTMEPLCLMLEQPSRTLPGGPKQGLHHDGGQDNRPDTESESGELQYGAVRRQCFAVDHAPRMSRPGRPGLERRLQRGACAPNAGRAAREGFDVAVHVSLVGEAGGG